MPRGIKRESNSLLRGFASFGNKLPFYERIIESRWGVGGCIAAGLDLKMRDLIRRLALPSMLDVHGDGGIS